MMRRARLQGRAFTLVELLVVIAIIMVLLAMLVPLLQRAKELARSAKCRSQIKALCFAASAYSDQWKCFPAWHLCPNGPLTDPGWYWYQKEILGRFFGEDIPKYGTLNGRNPPAKSMVRCPSDAVWADIAPDRSWIGYNLAMSGNSQEMGPYRRGPKLEEIFTPTSNLVLFQDSRSSGFWYICRWAYNHCAQSYAAGNVRRDEWEYGGWPYNTCDFRHEGGVNYGFADGHARYVADPDAAFAQHLITASRR